MRNLIVAVILAGGLAFVGGCDKPEPVAVGGGVIDLQKIAHETGRDTVIRGQMQAANMQIQTEMKRAEGELRKRITEAATSHKETLTAEQINERVAQNERMMLAQQSERAQQEIITRFRTDIDPAVIKAAQAKGIGMVFIVGLPGSPTIMVTDKGADISDDVIQEIKDTKDFFSDAGTPGAPADGGAGQGPPGMSGGPGESGAPGMAPGMSNAPSPAVGRSPTTAPMSPTAPPEAPPAKLGAPSSSAASAPAHPAGPPASQPAEPMK